MIGESSPAYHYNTSVAMEFFRFAGRPKTFAKGKKIFSENQRGIPFLLMPNRMYLLLDGEVGIFSGDKPVATVQPGQIFYPLFQPTGSIPTIPCSPAWRRRPAPSA